MSDYMKRTCELCPFSRTKTLFLHPERAEELANMASNPYNDFPCHKTADCVEDSDGSSGYVHGEDSKTCHGFLNMQTEENGNLRDGFKPDGDGFTDYFEMVDRHQELWDAQRGADMTAPHQTPAEQRIIDDLERTPLEHWTSMDIAAHTQARVKSDAGRKDT